jgi:hypothetical protein
MVWRTGWPGPGSDDHERTVEKPVVVDVRIVLGLLERVTAQVEQQRDAQFDERLTPDPKASPRYGRNPTLRSRVVPSE